MANFALDFGTLVGNTGRITVPNAAGFQGLTALTIQALIKMPNYPASQISRIVNYQSGNTGYSFSVTTAGKLSGSVGNGTTSATSTSNSNNDIPINTTTHIAMTWNGTAISVWINGIRQTQNSSLSGGNTGDPGASILIGNRSDFIQCFTGIIEELEIANIARYSANFSPNMGIITPDANTIELFHFDEGTGTTTTGVNGNVGTIAGTPTPAWVDTITLPAIPKRTLSLLGV